MTDKEFVFRWTAKLSSEGIKNFPGDFCSFTEYSEISLPAKAIVIGENFFGSFELLGSDGSQVYQAASHEEAKYIVYSSRQRPKSIRIPADEKILKLANSGYEHYLDSVIKQIEIDYKKEFSSSKNFNSAVNEIFRGLNLVRY